eukprot:12892901-Prorocentrum_lima.AAC.1
MYCRSVASHSGGLSPSEEDGDGPWAAWGTGVYTTLSARMASRYGICQALNIETPWMVNAIMPLQVSQWAQDSG